MTSWYFAGDSRTLEHPVEEFYLMSTLVSITEILHFYFSLRETYIEREKRNFLSFHQKGYQNALKKCEKKKKKEYSSPGLTTRH